MEIVAAAGAAGLRILFGFLLVLVLGAGFYAFRHRAQFFGYRGDHGDTCASANLRMWFVILVWIDAVVITTLMIRGLIAHPKTARRDNYENVSEVRRRLHVRILVRCNNETETASACAGVCHPEPRKRRKPALSEA